MVPSSLQMFRAAAAVLSFLAAAPALADDGPPLDFLTGDYVFVGREPDGGAAYAGSARIEINGDRLVLHRRRGDRETVAEGGYEVPSPPGEGRVLRFRWRDPDPMTMTCMVSADLDNYGRLTCLWLRDGTEPAQPGIEAMFATGGWPKPGQP